ncbi:MAG: NAD(P)/FAD-dependent oxidoreductase [Ketobacteraceae bacterium]|nr:NAD(P)/FAD-dependent oxidoreductase [Ketobacteraceae bacterium]
MNALPSETDVLIIGAGPAGAVAAGILVDKGYQVTVLEKEHFPRFSIGESLLPQSMIFLEEAGLLEAVHKAGFQLKNGAAFCYGDRYDHFCFEEKFTPGYGTTYQVERSRFDKILADGAAEKGAEIFYGITVTAVDVADKPRVTCTDEAGNSHSLQARMLLDASGFGRVLPRLLALDKPSDFPVRHSLFTHIRDHISEASFDRDKILITVHHRQRDVWFWLIPFADGRSSVGVVATPAYLDSIPGDNEQKLLSLIHDDPNLGRILRDAEVLFSPRSLKGYSCNVSTLHGNGFALLGNAGEFLDPVFSSGVTIALKSASLAAHCTHRQLQGETVDWSQDYAQPLMRGVETFRVFVESWYDTRLQDIIFSERKNTNVKAMICSILAGYAWDTRNPYVAESRGRVDVLARVCREMG